LLEDRPEEARLALEVVIERAPGDARRPDDLLGAHVRVAPLGEQPAGGGDQRGAGRGGAFGLRPAPSRSRPAPHRLRAPGDLLLDIQAVCMLDTYSLYGNPAIGGNEMTN